MAEPVLTSRDLILALVRDEPGLHLRELPRRLGLSLRSVRYHLDAMERDGRLERHPAGGFVRWFPSGLSRGECTLISALRVRGQRVLLGFLLRQGASRFSELLSSSRMSPAVLHGYLGRLGGEGIIQVSADRRYGLVDADAVRMQLSMFRVRFPDLLADAARDLFEDTR